MKIFVDAPFAVASDGTVLLNLSHTDGSLSPKSMLERALRSKRPVFVAVPLDEEEVAAVLELLSHNFEENALSIALAVVKGR